MYSMKIVKIDTNTIPNNNLEIRLYSIIRNEKVRLPFFIEYYKKLGVSRFFFLDNSSDDNPLQILNKYDNVHTFLSKDSFEISATYHLKQLVEKYSKDNWCLVLDADEFLRYPLDKYVSLNDLIRYLERRKKNSLTTILLDMYSSKLLRETSYKPNQNPFEICEFFDKNGYWFAKSEKKFFGGVRKRIFGIKYITLTKHPLFKCDDSLHQNFWGLHEYTGYSSENIISGVLFHFKFFQSFIKRAQEEAKREEHSRKAIDYKHYVKTDLKNLILFSTSHSVLFINFFQLYLLKLVSISPDYLFFVLLLKLKKLFSHRHKSTNFTSI